MFFITTALILVFPVLLILSKFWDFTWESIANHFIDK